MRSFLPAFLLALSSCGGVTGSGQGTGDSGTPKDGTVADAMGVGDATGAGDGKIQRDVTVGDRANAGDSLAEAMASDGGGNAEASVGSPCQKNADCPVLCVDDAQCGPLCLDQAPFTGGYCSRAIGECPAPSGSDAGSGPCPVGTFCANGQPPVSGTGGDYCLLACKTSGDCRTAEGYKCCPGLTHAGASVCAPASLCP